jgi:RNA polymerase sigma factor (sigma-70 family)
VDAALNIAIVSQLFQEHNRALVGYLTARLRSEHEAKEVAQEAYVRLLQLHKPGTPSLFRAYLFKTATNLAIDRLRRKAVRYRADNADRFGEVSAVRTVAESPEDQMLAQELTLQLNNYLGELPEIYQQVFRLHRLDGLDQREVGQRLGFSDRMVRRYVTYAMVYCRLRLTGLAPDDARARTTL